MKFRCKFGNPDTREERFVDIDLPADDVAMLKRLRKSGDPHIDVKEMCAAPRAAYPLVPDGFVHFSGGVERIHLLQ